MTQELAKSQGVEWLDLTSIVADKYQQMGAEATKAMFGPDYVHTSPVGADLNAASVVAGLKILKNQSLMPFLNEKGRAVPAAGAAPLVPVTNIVPTDPVAAPVPKPADATPVTPPTTRRPLPVPADPALATLFFIGDSTVRNGQGDGSNGQWGWGEPIADYFDQNKINVVNRAVGGLSSRTYLTGGFWGDTLPMIKRGDFLIMQFGHNDSGAINDTSRARATLRGNGEDIEQIDNLLTKKPETVHTYGWYLRRFIADAREKGATVMVCSPIPRKGFNNGKANRNGGTYGAWAREAALQSGAAFIPLNEIIALKYDALGPERVEPLFADANTHTSLEGAEINAQSVVEGLKALPGNPLAPYFSTKVKDVAPAQVTTQP
jgi:lysophospholipase L1-like esterase